MSEILIIFLFIAAFATMSSLFTITIDYYVRPHNQTQLVRVPHGVYLPHGGRRCKDDCSLIEFEGFP